MKDPLFKSGDRVKIKSKWDPGCTSTDYPQAFIEDMVLKFGGKTVTIVTSWRRTKTDRRLENDDLYTYNIAEDSKQYVWTSSMFDLGLKSTSSSISIKRRHKTKLKFAL